MGSGGGVFDNIGGAVSNVGRGIGNAIQNPGQALGGALTGGLIMGPMGQVLGGLGQLPGMGGNQSGGGGVSFDMSGQPQYPGYQNAYDPSKNAMLPKYEEQIGKNSQGFNQFSKEALRTGPSAWAGLAGAQQDQLASKALQKGQASAKGAASGAMNDLAASGGLSSGARERIAEGGAKALINNSQNVAGQTATNKMQIGINDEQNRMNSLAALPGMEMGRNNAWGMMARGDQENDMKNRLGENMYNMEAYKAAMAAWGANKQAQATANSGKK